MQPEFEIQTPSLAASTELLVMAPIRRGFVPVLDTITYKSRVKLLLKLLHAGRQSQHEYRPLRAMSDAVERVGVIKSLRVAVVEGQRDVDDRILLSVHFDGSYEAYVRTIWQRAARLLDLIFCNAEGYVTGWDNPFDDWNAWIRSVQVSTPFFYATPGVTYADQTYLQMFEHRDRGGEDDDLRRTRIAVPTAEEIAWSVIVKERDPTKRDDETPAKGPMVKSEIFRQNLGALAGIYRLSEWYMPGTPDGRVLHNAAHELLPQLRDMFLFDPNGLGVTARTSGGERLAKALDWFTCGMLEVPAARAGTILPVDPPVPKPEGDVQAGILQPYSGVTDGVMALLAFESPAAAATLLRALPTTPETRSDTPANTLLVNLALTLEGLRLCGLTQEELDLWPVEFRQGMSARAGLLGDLRWNHPRRWNLPRSNGALKLDPARDDRALPAVPLESVHAVAQFRWRPADGTDRALSRGALATAVENLLGSIGGIRRLSVQWLARQTFGEKESTTFVDHFGYTDGQSQPELGRRKTEFSYSNQVHLGEVLVGYANAADREQDQAINRDPQARALMRNGSFLAVRKLRQRPAAFHRAVAAAQKDSGIDEQEIRALMMGRWPADAGGDAGKPLGPFGAGGINDFSYREDPGHNTPAAAHIRRANPRDFTDKNDYPKPAPGGRPPRIMRRSMPYGPAFGSDANDDADRGLMFMAYGASLAEQFEVIQGWLAGGNSSRSYSGAGCPFLGVPEAGMARTFRFEHGGSETIHMALDGCEDLGTEPEPLVSLQWGLYAFAPSRSAQALLAQRAAKALAVAALPWSVHRGQALIDHLRRIEADEGPAAGTAAWKAALEDPDSLARFDNASIWSAVRELHGGVLRIPYGVLVAAPDLVRAVLSDPITYTADGYRRRLVAAGMGPIYLGRDPSDPEYGRLSRACNQAIQDISMEEGYHRGRRAAGELLESWIQQAIDNAALNDDPSWELNLDGRDLAAQTLATLAEEWFGLDDHTTPQNGKGLPLFERGTMDWRWQPGEPVYYPGHCTAASRATFQAEPSARVTALAALHGTALTASLQSLIHTKGVAAFDTARVSKAVLAAFWSTEPDVAVQNIAGALMGLLPTTEGILRRLLPEWTRAGTLLQLAAEAAGKDLGNWAVAEALLRGPLRQSLKFKPVPEQVWREAQCAHRLGGAAGVPIMPGDKLIVGQVSALHAQLEEGDTLDVFAAFGGPRVPGGATHACPGYEAAIGAMMGLMSAILDRKEGRLVPSASPGVLVFRGSRETTGDVEKWAVLDNAKAGDQPGAGHRLLAFGDSWMRFQEENDPNGSDFFRALGALGYDTSDFNNSDYAYRGRTLKTMSEYGPRVGVYSRLRSLVLRNTPPLAVLVSGGGNDFVDGILVTKPLCERLAGVNSKLDAMLRKQTDAPQYADGLLTSFLDEMKQCMTTIVSNLALAAQDAKGKQVVPIILVAYDFPIPDGRSFKSFCPWLEPNFNRKGYPAPDTHGDGDSTKLMKLFISRLNEAYGHVAQQLSVQGIQVRHVPLTGVLAQLQQDRGLNYDQVWKNELHPNRVGFEALARHLHDVALKPLLQAVIVTP